MKEYTLYGIVNYVQYVQMVVKADSEEEAMRLGQERHEEGSYDVESELKPDPEVHISFVEESSVGQSSKILSDCSEIQ